jgi:hypothetical protein
VRKHVLLGIVADLSSSDNYFTKRFEATKKEGISLLEKCTTAVEMAVEMAVVVEVEMVVVVEVEMVVELVVVTVEEE